MGSHVGSHLSICLLSMPWATSTRPSLSLGLLSSIAGSKGYECDVLYPNVFLSALIGCNGYGILLTHRRWEARSDRFPPCQTIIPAFRSQSGWPTSRALTGEGQQHTPIDANECQPDHAPKRLIWPNRSRFQL